MLLDQHSQLAILKYDSCINAHFLQAYSCSESRSCEYSSDIRYCCRANAKSLDTESPATKIVLCARHFFASPFENNRKTWFSPRPSCEVHRYAQSRLCVYVHAPFFRDMLQSTTRYSDNMISTNTEYKLLSGIFQICWWRTLYKLIRESPFFAFAFWGLSVTWLHLISMTVANPQRFSISASDVLWVCNNGQQFFTISYRY